MTPEQAAHETAPIVVSLPAAFTTDDATLASGSRLGFERFDFYFSGRGGVLGDVVADVVAAAFWIFSPNSVRAAWERSASVMPRRRAAEEWLEASYRFAREHFADGPDYAAATDMLGRVVTHAAVAGAPIFAALRAYPEPNDAKSLLQHRLYAVRELRGALHGAAVLTVGLRPVEAIAVRAPEQSNAFGWDEPVPEPGPLRERWSLAEARTDRMLGRHLAVLDDRERDALVHILREIAVSGS